MRNRIVAGFTMISFLSATGLPALALGPQAGNVESTSGQVMIQSGAGWQNLQDDNIPAGCTVRTGEDGQVIVRLGANRIRLAANTQLQVVSVGDQKAEVALRSGRVLGSAGDSLTVITDRSLAQASRGEFVLNSTSKGSELRVLSGDAKLKPIEGEKVSFGALGSLPGKEAAQLATVGELGKVSSVGEVALMGEWRTKGKGVRVRNTNESVGGQEDASPDQDVPPPTQPQPPVVNESPPPTTPPTTPPVTTPPTTPPPAHTVVTKAGFSWGWALGGLALLGGIIAVAASGDDDNDNVFNPGNPGVPSPALP
jgi:hypothetical protein